MHHKKCKLPKSASKKSKVWGKLLLHPALITHSTSIDLLDETFSVGRFSDCNLSINEHNVCRGILKHISRRHFIMRKQMVFGLLIVRITDLSFNGTYVNGVRIGKNNTFTLFDGDSLAIGKPSFTIFTFKDLCNGSGNNDRKNIKNGFSPDVMGLADAEMTIGSSLMRIVRKESGEDNEFDYLELS